MPSREFEEEDNAVSQPASTMLTKAICNDGACHAELDAKGTESESDAYVEKQFYESTGMLAWEKGSTFVHNSCIQAALFSATYFAYVLFVIMTHFSNRLFATQPYLNYIKHILAHYIVRSDVSYQ